MIEVFIGIGANLGDAHATVLAAIEDCRAMPDTRVTATSSLYRSAPIDSSGADYLNAVLAAKTGLTPRLLLAELQRIEARHGRERPYVNAPRTLDLDLLLYDQQIIDLPGLTVPHPRMHQRAFVLKPLVEIAPLVHIPGLGIAEHWLAEVADQDVERLPA
ncbi:2-amino-4-hydroxy-6-hydroxymethyldihydropteridine diphosphokinase [Piscinibacter sakaiensis]|uniref:2-amino-4-hydroxy-6- hydroxymethyldihydropteridine diphosphokinase n=1 Tax=Piscinibacter sakaiensis TaxID=1547922 RepID=UPI003AACCBA4